MRSSWPCLVTTARRKKSKYLESLHGLRIAPGDAQMIIRLRVNSPNRITTTHPIAQCTPLTPPRYEDSEPELAEGSDDGEGEGEEPEGASESDEDDEEPEDKGVFKNTRYH